MTRPSNHDFADVAVVGAGIVGLSTAWFLQERGFTVTVYDSDQAASGASWGNAGWLTPALTAPLPEPDVLRYGVRSALTPTSPVYVPPRLDPSLWRFLIGFARHCTQARWDRGMAAYAPINKLAIRAFEDLADAGATPRAHRARPFLACFRTAAEAGTLIAELDRIERAGQPVRYDYLTGPQVQQAQPAVGTEIGAAVLLRGQRYIHPPAFVRALAHSVVARGGKLRELVHVAGVETDGEGASLLDSDGGRRRHDAVVLATGAALGRLARPFGVRRVVHPGRGYSFMVTGEQVPDSPIYFPAQRVACTPLSEPAALPPGPFADDDVPLLRVAGMMEFRRADEPLDPRRIEAIVEATRALLPGVDLDHRTDEWVGSRPCTTDGLPLVGETRSSRVFVAGGHGMWGVALGPATGKLLAEQIATGLQPRALRPFDPLR
ncbi:amino acid dehydrogenase [Nocardioides silvaticus]|uniref:Amino acid dehydrogenase n=1 Tax=Nocardioides silvaticus TaxID=2201891 RepID=A0A316TAF9_9ACTN|nr:FAD-dependent oxidoreductase [Nocardioides silvaticus]PWN01227.1 amino acid dehydrogenase [Nocardioides silvaticus]